MRKIFCKDWAIVSIFDTKWEFCLCLVLYSITLGYIYYFNQTRFFTIDEYQYMAATNMVASGKTPYIDFYEHHTPLSYVLHSPFFLNVRNFASGALLFRKISFVYLLILSLFMAKYFRKKTDNLFLVFLGSTLPICIGFGLLSSIDYRSDCFAASTLMFSYLLTDMNQSERKKSYAFGAGLLLAISVMMTLKVVYFGVLSYLLLFFYDICQSRSSKNNTKVFVYPQFFLLAFGFLMVLFVSLCDYCGILERMSEIIFSDAIKHEKISRGIHFSSYISSFLSSTSITTIPILILAVYSLITRKTAFWIIVSFSVIFGTLSIKLQYPYNFIIVNFVIGVLAVSGAIHLEQRFNRKSFWIRKSSAILVYILGLSFLFNQISFTFHKTTNKHQIRLLEKLEKFAKKDDTYIDNSGSAIFLQPASYYYLHGEAHRKMYEEKFKKELVKDYMESSAYIMIKDFRYPSYVKPYLSDNFIRVDGDLFVYGKKISKNPLDTTLDFHVLRGAKFYFFKDSDINKHIRENIMEDEPKLIVSNQEIVDKTKIIEIPGSLKFSNDITFEAWIKPCNKTHNTKIVNAGKFWLLHWDSSFEVLKGGGFQVFLPGIFEDFVECTPINELNKWYHVVWTLTKEEFKFYLNGELTKYKKLYPSSTLNLKQIELLDIENSNIFPGQIKDFRLYEGAMPSCEIKKNAGFSQEALDANEVEVIVDTRTIKDGGVFLSKGIHKMVVKPCNEDVYISYLPPEFFIEEIGNKRHSMLFEY